MFARVLVWLVRLYQHTLSRLLPRVCRFTPSCSQYMIRAVELHGFWRGILLGCKRICRCNPLNPGGYDPVPGDTSGAGSEVEDYGTDVTEIQ